MRLIPYCRQGREELLHVVGLGQITLRTVGQMLQAALEEHGQGQFVGMSGDMRMLRVAERTGGVVHRAYDIAGEGQRGIMGSSLVGKCRYVVVPFGTIDALGAHQVRIGTLPATGNGSAVEVDQQMMLGGTLQQVDAIVHVLLGVAGEEVNLHTGHANLLAPGKLLLAVFGLVQAELRARGTIDPADRRVIPYHWLDAHRLGIVHRILNSLAVFHLVPFGINEHVWQMQGNGHIHVFLDDVVVVGAMIIGPVDPRHRAGMNPTGIGNLTGFRHIGHQRRFHHVGQRTDDGKAPGESPPYCPRGGFYSIPLGGRKGGFVGHYLIEVALAVQTRSGMTFGDIGLGEEDEGAVNRLQQGGITPASVRGGRGLGEEALVGVGPFQ